MVSVLSDGDGMGGAPCVSCLFVLVITDLLPPLSRRRRGAGRWAAARPMTIVALGQGGTIHRGGGCILYNIIQIQKHVLYICII